MYTCMAYYCDNIIHTGETRAESKFCAISNHRSTRERNGGERQRRSGQSVTVAVDVGADRAWRSWRTERVGADRAWRSRSTRQLVELTDREAPGWACGGGGGCGSVRVWGCGGVGMCGGVWGCVGVCGGVWGCVGVCGGWGVGVRGCGGAGERGCGGTWGRVGVWGWPGGG